MQFLDREGKTHSPFTCYPWPVHAVHSVPWNITVHSQNAKMFLHSHLCSGFARTSPSTSEPAPCTYCKLLHNHNIIMGARHRFLDGVDENTRWQYLSPAQMLSALERKTTQVRTSRLQALNIGRDIATRNCRLDSFKRLSIAISTQDVPRIWYFCLAKTQHDNTLARLWLILLGTDGLEKVFGMIRSIVGNDLNADQLQLTMRVDGAVQCVNILAEHPEYGGESRRLTVKSISEATDGDISSKYDHINPITWRGDVYVWNVVPLSVWQSGRKIAKEQLTGAGIEPLFESMEHEGGYDILCPLGNEQIILIGDLGDGEENEGDDETYDYDSPAQPEDHLQPSHKQFPKSLSLNDVPETELAPDVEDTAADIEVMQQPAEEVPKKYEAWIDVSEGGGGTCSQINNPSFILKSIALSRLHRSCQVCSRVLTICSSSPSQWVQSS